MVADNVSINEADKDLVFVGPSSVIILTETRRSCVRR